MTDPTPTMTKADREALAVLARKRAKQAEREAVMREKVLLAEVQDLITAEYEARDALWADAAALAEQYAAKANAQIQARCADLGIPSKHAPGLELGWRRRSGDFVDSKRRAELFKLAETRLAALTETAKTVINANLLRVEEQLILGGLDSDEAREFLASMPTVEQLMPALSLDDLGVVRWQPPEDAATQLTTPLTPTDRKRRQIRRAIEANPGASDRKIGEILGCDHKTVAAHRRKSGEFPAIDGESPEGAE
jgi:hypothetical protein